MIRLQLEAIVLANLCHPSAEFRALSINLLRAIAALSPAGVESSLAGIVFFFGEEIMQNARYRYLLDVAGGIQSNVKIHNASLLPSVQEAACSPNSTLWPYVLAEIGRACSGKDLNLSLVRELVSKRLAALPLPVKPDEAVSPAVIATRLNYHALYMSISGGLRLDEQEALTKTVEDYVYSRVSGTGYVSVRYHVNSSVCGTPLTHSFIHECRTSKAKLIGYAMR